MSSPLLFVVAAFALLGAYPFFGGAYGIDLVAKMMIYAIFALSLELLVGGTGLVCFGQAAFFGVGAYAAVRLSPADAPAALMWLLPASVVAGALVALAVGALSLRTRGVYFIMITLAFAQMLYYLANSTKGYGGDEGLTIRARSDFGFGLDLKDATTFYYVALAVLAACLVALARFVPSRLGRAVIAIRDDELRAEALGLPTFRLRLVVFVVAGMIGGVAGLLTVNQQGYVSPNLLHWMQSGTLMVMVILGGVATLWGGVLGAAALLLLQEGLSAYTAYWEFWTGWVLLAVVLFARNGLAALLRPVSHR